MNMNSPRGFGASEEEEELGVGALFGGLHKTNSSILSPLPKPHKKGYTGVDTVGVGAR